MPINGPLKIAPAATGNGNGNGNGGGGGRKWRAVVAGRSPVGVTVSAASPVAQLAGASQSPSQSTSSEASVSFGAVVVSASPSQSSASEALAVISAAVASAQALQATESAATGGGGAEQPQAEASHSYLGLSDLPFDLLDPSRPAAISGSVRTKQEVGVTRAKARTVARASSGSQSARPEVRAKAYAGDPEEFLLLLLAA